jgi:hypothetical protein
VLAIIKRPGNISLLVNHMFIYGDIFTLSIMVINRTNTVKSLRVTFGVATPDKVEMWSTK